MKRACCPAVQLVCWIYPIKPKSRLTLVYPQQANPEQGFISVLSPLGAALLGKNVGEVAEVKLLRRPLRFLLCDLMSVKQPPAFLPSVQENSMKHPLPQQALSEHALPQLVLSSLDLDRLDQLLNTLPASDPARFIIGTGAGAGRDSVEPEVIPPNVVTMNSTVRSVFQNRRRNPV